MRPGSYPFPFPLSIIRLLFLERYRCVGFLFSELSPQFKKVLPQLLKENISTNGVLFSVGFDTDTERHAQIPRPMPTWTGDIAPVAALLALGDARWLNGEHLIASGGLR
jgi:3-oxoacyl-[acyl-carrier protein] reductase